MMRRHSFLLFTTGLLMSIFTGAPGCDQGTGGITLTPAPAGGERWTIRCLQSTAADRKRTIDLMAEALRKVKGLNPQQVRTQHSVAISTLYYGSYAKVFDAQTNTMRFPPEMTKDIKFIRDLTQGDQLPFRLAEPELVENKAEGPPEWDLRKAPGQYSLQVGVFYNEGEFQERQAAAVQYCKVLRDEGIEAWYMHGDNGRSIVTVGHFDEKQTQMVKQPDGSLDYSPEIKRVLAQKEEFKYNLINGRIRQTRRPGMEFAPDLSFLVPIPTEKDLAAPDWGLEPAKP